MRIPRYLSALSGLVEIGTLHDIHDIHDIHGLPSLGYWQSGSSTAAGLHFRMIASFSPSSIFMAQGSWLMPPNQSKQ